jgi:hypothetical protein
MYSPLPSSPATRARSLPGVVRMPHNARMGQYQLVTVTSDRGAPDVQVLPADRDLDPTSFDIPGQRPVYLGSEDIVGLALTLSGNDYEATAAAVADARFERIDPSEVESEVTDLLRALNHGAAGEVSEVLAREFDGLIIEALTLQGVHSHRGSVLRILQDGRFEVVRSAPNTRPVEDVRRALVDS